MSTMINERLEDAVVPQQTRARAVALPAPKKLKEQLPVPESFGKQIQQHRQAVSDIIEGKDERLLVIVGPCSIHDEQAAIEYGRRLAQLQAKLADKMLLVMRAYFEKPRTTVGWKGMIYDPDMNGRHDVESGLHNARGLLLELASMGLPLATEALNPIATNYLEDLLSWVAVGARTTESQTHREMASALNMPVGFKNGTDGSIDIAVQAMLSASHPHSFFGVTDEGGVAVIQSQGNPDTHLVLRGGKNLGKAITNYDRFSVTEAAAKMQKANLNPAVIVDCSHENSGKNHERQPDVFLTAIAHKAAGLSCVKGVMIESFIEDGREDISEDNTFGRSVTDACLGWDATESMIIEGYNALCQSD